VIDPKKTLSSNFDFVRKEVSGERRNKENETERKMTEI
jgi:hypothetical protein